MTPIAVDFETAAIDKRPNYPPIPVGVAIQYAPGDAHYFAWGHPSNNNCTFGEGMDALNRVWTSREPMVFHNAKFDVAVATEKLGLPMPHWSRVHDTMFLHYLYDPHAARGGLKEIAEELLQWSPEERDEVADWIWENRRELVSQYGGKITRSKHGPHSAGAWLSKAPGDIVGRYAVGDVARTAELFDSLYRTIKEEGMLPAYRREQRLLPILMENERNGIRVDLEGLERNIGLYTDALEFVDDWLRWRLKAPGLSFNDDVSIAQVFASRGIVKEEDWKLTKSGQLSISKENLHPKYYTDQEVANAFGYRNRLETCLKMFMQPWAEQALRRGDGRVATNWNQTRNPEGGTRTGRPSTNDPNFLNISKNFEGRPDGYTHPGHLDVPALPLVRKFILPDSGHVFCHRDFDGQELRVFAHFESGSLWEAYHENPKLDVHQKVADDIKALVPDTQLDRTKTKIINFRTIYGSGATGLSKSLMCSIEEAKRFKAQHGKALPGIKILSDEIARIVRRGDPIRTWGGRVYYPEPPKFSEKFGRTMDFEYKLINYLVQGSAADLTKQAIIDWYDNPDRSPDSRFLVTVYDELDLSVPAHCAISEMNILKQTMEAPRLSVPMLSSGKWGLSWGSVEKFDDAADQKTLDTQLRAILERGLVS